MFFKSTAAAAALLLASTVVADKPIATVDPCPAAHGKYGAITVTSQYQPVSTCGAATTQCRGRGRGRGRCRTVYPFSTYSYVSTVIPGVGDDGEDCTVTDVNQLVTVSKFVSTVTSYKGATTTKDGREVVYSTPVYSTVAKNFVLPYNQIGPNAIPGYGGSGLCKDCEADKDGNSNQGVDVTECRSGPNGPRCVRYRETWISKGNAPTATDKATAAISTKYTPQSAGVHTFSVQQTAAPTTIWRGGRPFRFGGHRWWARFTRNFPRGGVAYDVTETVTTTITRHAPWDRVKGSDTSAAAFPTGKNAFPGWSRPANAPAEPTKGAEKDPNSGSTGGWGDWDPVNDGGNTYSSASSTRDGGYGSSSYSRSDAWTGSNTYTASNSYTASNTWTGYGSSSSSISSSSYSNTDGPVTTTYSTSSSSSTTTTSSSTTTTYAGNQPIPTEDSFYITVDLGNAKYHKRATQYIGFGGDRDAEVVTDITAAALFNFDSQGYLMSGGLFVDLDTSLGFLAFQLTPNRPATNGGWTNNDGVITLAIARFGFCVTTTSDVFIQFSNTPSFTCVIIRFKFIYRRNVQTSTSSSSTSTSTSSSMTTTSSTTTTTTSSSSSMTTTSSTITSTTTSYSSTGTFTGGPVTQTTTSTADPSADMDEPTQAPTSTQLAFRHKRHYGRVY